MEKELIIKLNFDKGQADRQAKEFADAERARIKQVLTDFEVAEKAKAQVIERSNKKRIDAEVKAMETTKNSWGVSQQAIESTVKAVGSFAAQMAGLQSAQAVVGVISDHFRAANREAMEAAKFVQGYREALLELAALKGQMGNTTKTLAEELAFRSKTLQTASQAKDFQLGALGVGAAAIDAKDAKGNMIQKLISPDEFQKALVMGGKFQATENESAETHGRLVGSLPGLYGQRMTGEDVFAKEQQLFNINQPGGSSFGSATDQFLKNSGYVTSKLITPERMMALQSAFSVAEPAGAGTRVQQFIRGTVGGLSKMRGSVGLDGEPNEKLAEFLKDIGATDQMDPLQIGDLVSQRLEDQEKAAADQGKKFNALKYLQEHGQGNIEDANAQLLYHGFRKQSLAKTFLPLAETPVSVAEAMAPIDARQRIDPVFQGRRADNAEELAKISVGGAKEEQLNSMFRVAFSTLQQKGEISGGTYEGAMENPLGMFSPTELAFGPKRKTEMEAQARLAEEAKRLGIDPQIPFGRSGTKVGQQEARFMGRDKLYELSQQVRAKGGDIQGGLQGLDAAAQKMLQAAQAFERGAEKNAAAGDPKNKVIQAKPVVQTR